MSSKKSVPQSGPAVVRRYHAYGEARELTPPIAAIPHGYIVIEQMDDGTFRLADDQGAEEWMLEPVPAPEPASEPVPTESEPAPSPEPLAPEPEPEPRPAEPEPTPESQPDAPAEDAPHEAESDVAAPEAVEPSA